LEEIKMPMQYDTATHTMAFTRTGAEPRVVPALLVNRCTCGAVLRAYLDLGSNQGFNLEDYLHGREAARYEVKRFGKHVILYPSPYPIAHCCPREKYLSFDLLPMVIRWLKKQQVEPEPGTAQQMMNVLTAEQVPGFGLIRDEITGDPMGFTWLQRAIYGGERHWSGKLCQHCYAPAYAYDNVCRACGSEDLTMVQTETWEQADERRRRGWENLWRTLGFRRPE
jgi:ribosomal protein L40E